MKILRIVVLILFLGLVGMPELAYGHNHIVRGKVLIKNGKSAPVPGATVRIENTVLGTVANQKGDFILRGIPDGTHRLLITAVGFKPLTYMVEFEHTEGDEVMNLNLELEESPVVSANVVVTATRSPKIYEDTPVKVSVVDDKIFQSTQSFSLKEGLGFQPGLRVETNCQNCGFSQVRMNGLEGHYSQILIDSRPVFSTLSGVYGLDQLPTNMIDRIEIIRGGGSSLYGGNAIAGVINIITKEPAYNTFQASLNRGFIDSRIPDNTFQMSGTIMNDLQDFGVFIYGMSRNRNAWDSNGDGFSEISMMNVTNFGGRLFYKPDYLSKLTIDYQNTNHEQRGGNNLYAPPHEADIAEAVHYKTNSGGFTYEQYLPSSTDKFSLYGSMQHTWRDSYYGAERDPDAYGWTDNYSYVTGIQYTKILENFLGAEHILTGGYEFHYDWMNDFAPSYDRNIDQLTRNHGFYIQDDFAFNNIFNFVIGTRFDKHNLIEDFIISPRANILVKLLNNLSWRGSFSTGFRAPQAFDEDLHITQVGGQGMVITLSDDLKEERSISFGTSVDYSFNLLGLPIAFSLEYFTTTLNDIFILEDAGRDENGNLILERRNGSAGIVSGGTFEFNIAKGTDFNFISGITYQKSLYDELVEWSEGSEEDDLPAQFSDKILRTPDIYAYFTMNARLFKNFDFNLSGIFTGPMWVPHYRFEGYGEPDVMKRTDSFFELNTKISYRFSSMPVIELSLGCQNILNSFQSDFDKGIELDAGYIYGPSRPLTVFVGIKTEL